VTESKWPVQARIDNVSFTIIPEDCDVNDVTGAGDCFLAAFVYGLVDGVSMHNALKLACAGATESVKHVGTYVLTEKDLKKKVIFTNGCFDVLHKGHLTLLKKARAMGDKLVVGLNSDASVNVLKGNGRPFNDVNTRIEQLELIPYVDEVIVFDEDTPILVIKKLRPDVIVKGGDYRVEEVVGHDISPVRIIPLVEGHSTTEILKDRK
jgi:D-beta-D-heptose 7-phosphate kinase/D-beta-D-heptose 1-phosphate adenosyltransferase